MAVNSCNSEIASISTLLPRSSCPLFKISAASFAAAKTGTFSLIVLTSFSRRGIAFSKVCRSAKQSSVLIVSISFFGLTSPSTWTTSPSLNTLITWQIASDSLMFAKNLFPSPAPSEAPLTIPAISTKETAAGKIFSEVKIFARTANLVSGTPTTPTLGSMVANG